MSEDLHVSYQADAMKKEKEKLGVSEHGSVHKEAAVDYGSVSHLHPDMPKNHDGNFKSHPLANK